MKQIFNPIVNIKTEIDGSEECEIEIIPTFDFTENDSILKTRTSDQRLLDLETQLFGKEEKISKLECHADGVDYAVAAACGVLTGLLDVSFVGEFSFENARKWGTKKCNKFVENFANKTAQRDPELKDLGKDFKFENLQESIGYLEKKYRVNYDIAGSELGQGDHHLYDFAHHPSLLGLIISVIAQLSGQTLGCNRKGIYKWVNVTNSPAKLQGKNIFEKFFNAITNWGCHLISDMAGSSSAKHGGTGIPGPIMSMFQEIVGIFKKKDSDASNQMQNWLNSAFNGTLEGQNGVPFDLRTELGLYAHLGKQAIVVGINETIVRAFYFIRQLIVEIKAAKIKSFKELLKINWKNTLPFKNRTIIRMLTISMSTMSAIDTADAGIRAAIDCGGNGGKFLLSFLLRINYIGIGRTVIACVSDGVLGINLNHERTERIKLYNEYIALNNAKLFYKQGDLWLLADDVEKSINHTIIMIKQSEEMIQKYLIETRENIKLISENIDKVEKNNEGLKKDIKDMLKWGI